MICEKEIIQYVLKNAKVTRIAMSINDEPYIVPMNYGYDKNCLYLHTGDFGKKIDILNQNNKICFEMDINHELVKSDRACKWSMKFLSVIGFGNAIFLEDKYQKLEALKLLMNHYSNDINYEFDEEEINKVNIIKVMIDSITAREKT